MTDNVDEASDRGKNAGDRRSGNVVSAASRRRLIKGGLSATPVVLTLISRPVLGFENACLSPSRMTSGNHSGFTGPISCGGSNRSHYASLLKATGQPPRWANDSFEDIFGIAYETQSNGVPDQIGRVFLDSYAGNDKNPNSIGGFASYIIAAYLNALGNVGSVSSVLTSAQVVAIWNDVIGTGQYCPQINMCWNATGVVDYLRHSGIVPS